MARKKISNRPARIRRIKLKRLKSFAEIGPDNKYWVSGSFKTIDRRCKGISFIKVFPPSDAIDGLIVLLKAYLKNELGAEVIKVMPKALSDKLLSDHKRIKRQSIRKVVLEYAKNSNSIDHKSLTDTLNRTMDKVGL